MELIASSRIIKAQQRLDASLPYLTHLTRSIGAAASTASDVRKHPLMANDENRTRAAILIVTADRGLAGAYSSNALKAAESLATNLRAKGMSIELYVVGRKGVGFYRFRERAMAGEYTGFTDQPTYADAKRIGGDLLDAFLTPDAEGDPCCLHALHLHGHPGSSCPAGAPAGGSRRSCRQGR